MATQLLGIFKQDNCLDSYKEKKYGIFSKILFLIKRCLKKIAFHLGLFSKKINYNHNLPITLWWFEDNLYVIKTNPDYAYLLNKKIFKICDMDVCLLRERIGRYILSDNDYGKRITNSFFIGNKSILSYLGLLDGNSEVSITFEKETNHLKTVRLFVNSKINNDVNRIYSLKDKNKIISTSNIGRNEITKIQSNKNIHFEMIKDMNISYLQINEFSDIQSNRNTKDDFRIILKEMFSKMKSNNIENLIIDLRYNTGKRYELMFLLLSYISNKSDNHLHIYYSEKEDYIVSKYINQNDGMIDLQELDIFKNPQNIFYMPYPKKDIQFDGNIFVFVGNESFGISPLFSEIIKANKYGFIIGEPTGNATFSPIEYPVISFHCDENSPELNIYKARMEEKILKCEPDAVYPDIYIPTTFEDYLANKDSCWEYTMKFVKKLKNIDYYTKS